ncbi:RHS repeat domain-containing protein [Roseivirga seohaensis]|uniref:RHS repeat domain-containing protein n=1 Tax=Roseivirga seohaensis TaxID=1914963 RepID=UPI003BAD1A00
MRNRFLIFIAAICASFYGYAQDVPQLIPPSPDQAAINKFGDIPVNYSSGLVNIDIPIYNISTKSGLTIPISLNYHAGGVRVDEIASNVGLGWALSLGNSISASVRGAPDFSASGLAYVGGSSTLPARSTFQPNGTSGDYAHEIIASQDYELAKGSSENIVDSQFDFFNLNFAGRSSKFLIDQSRVAHTIPFEPLRIDVLHASFEDYFVVYDENGNRFTFNVVEKSKVSNGCSTKWNLSDFIFKNISQVWYLSEIKTVDGEIVTFHYTAMPYWYSYKLSESETLDLAISPSGLCISDTNPTGCDSYMEIIEGQRLDSISFLSENGKVLFDYSNRQDEGSPKVSSIQVKINDLIVKDYQMTYGYFGDQTTTADDDRLKLESIDETTSDQKWVMQYDESQTMPPRFSTAQDFWGFYNGQSSNSSHIPSYTNSNLGVSYAGADRSVNFSYAKTYSLRKIYYPTGGYSEFEYEVHQYYGEDFLTEELGNHNIGGLRIKKITNAPDSNSPSIIRSFDYNSPAFPARSSGKLIDKPKFDSRKRQREFVNYTGDETFDFINFCDKVVLSSSSYNTLGRSSGIGVAYEYVTEKLGSNGDGGKTVYKYSTFPDVENNPQYSDLPDQIFVYSGTGAFPPIEYSSNDIIEIHNETTSFAFRRGLLLQKSVYNSDDILLTKEDRFYDFNYDLKEDVFNHPVGDDSFILNDIVIKQLYGEATVYYRTAIKQELESTKVPAVFLYIYSELTSAWVQLKKTESTTYTDSGDFTVVTDYSYGNKTHQQVTQETVTDSEGNTWVSKSYYPDDISGSGSLPGGTINNNELTAANKMKDAVNHQVSSVLQTERKKNDVLISRTRNNYKNWSGTFVAPESIETSKGDNLLEQRIVYHAYDNEGNPTEVSKEGDIRISYLWGYNSAVPVIQGQNITYATLMSAVTAAISGWTSKPVGVTNMETLLANVGDMTTPTQKAVWKEFLIELNAQSAIGTTNPISAMTYKPGFGMTSQTDTNGISTFYEYDSAGRLVLVRDNDGKIVKTYVYNYKAN